MLRDEYGFGATAYQEIDPSDLTKGVEPTVSSTEPRCYGGMQIKTQLPLAPIAFASHALTKGEADLWISELEMAGLVFACKKMCHYLETSPD